MKPLDRAKLFLAKAIDDVKLIEVVLSSEKVTDEIIGFHAQQAAEKLLKTVLMAKGIPFRRTHDLRELMDLLADHGLELPTTLNQIRYLTPFAVEFRYDYLPSEDESPFDRWKAFELVRQLRAWVEEVIEP